MIVTTAAQLAAVIDEYSAYDEFVVDLETVYIPTPEEQDEADRVRAIVAKNRTVDESKWLEVFKLKATDPLVNTIIWIGLAGPGGSGHSIPVGHPKGRLLTHQRIVGKPAFDVFAEGDPRRMTKLGKPSQRTIKVTEPATFAPPPSQLPLLYVISNLRQLFFSFKRIIGWNLKFDLKTLAKYFGSVAKPEFPTGPYADAMLAVHLIDEKRRDYMLASVTKDVFGSTYEKLGSKGVENFSFGRAAKYTVQDCRYEWLIWLDFKERIRKKESLWRFYTQYEWRFYDAIMRMEWEGVQVNTEMTKVLRKSKEKEIASIIDQLVVDFGAPPGFNPNARNAVRELVYKKYRAPVLKKTDKAQDASTDAETLQAISELRTRDSSGELVEHRAAPVARLLLKWADENKVLSTYLVGTVPRLDRRGRVHADYLLHGTETSRLSCVSGSTVLHTSRGDFRMDEYLPEEGDLVPTHGGTWQPVVRKILKGNAAMKRVALDNGCVIECTDEHRLLTPSGWTYVVDLHEGSEVLSYDSVDAIRGRPDQRQGGGAGVSCRGQADGDGAGEEVGYAPRQRHPHSEDQPAGGSVSVREGSAVLTIEDRCQEPDVGRERGAAPSVQGRGVDWQGLRAEAGERQVRARTRQHDARPVGIEWLPRGHRGASHRREQDEQLGRQPRRGDDSGTSSSACRIARVREVAALGTMAVWDIEVAGDHSYAAQGVLSHNCREPNIQNIPRESEMRGMYEAPDGHVLIIGDYDQIELRWIAYLSQDPAMLELFRSGRDIHRGTAAKVLAKAFEDVTDGERQDYGKMPNFLLGYGGGAYNLSEKTGIPEKRAQAVLDAYFKEFARINPWKYSVIRQARNRGRIEDGRMVAKPWVETMLGRRRRLPDLFSSSSKLVKAAERQAVNTITQGSASETALLAMVAVTEHAQRTGFPMKLIINVHDELVCTVPTRHAEEGQELLKSLMTGVTIPHTGERPFGDDLQLAAKVVVGERWLK